MPKKSSARKSAPARKAGKSTAVRKTSVPKTQRPAAPLIITDQMIALRAYEIWQSGQGGTQDDHWLRAERELRGL